jgi:hypothetical protein
VCDARLNIREALSFQPVQRAGCVTVKVFLKAIYMQPHSEGIGRNHEKRGKKESVNAFHG